MHKITVIGVGPGGPQCLTRAAETALAGADVLVGGRRHLQVFAPEGKETFEVANNLREAVNFIKEKRHLQVAVIATGDPGMYGILSYLRRYFSPDELLVIPGISSVQEAFARIAMPWQDAAILSAHGREPEALVEIIKSQSKVAVLTGPAATSEKLAMLLDGAGMGERTAYLCYDLTLPGEEIVCIKIRELSRTPMEVRHNCVMVILDE